MAVISHHTMSLDGYIAGPDDAIDWSFAYGAPTSLAERTMQRIGAIIAGRRWYDMANERWNGVDGIYGGKYDGLVFIVTHRPPAEAWDARIRFVPEGLDAAVAAAHAAAGDKDVGVFGGTLTRQCIAAGLLDEIVLHVVPVLLGDGVRLLGGTNRKVELERIQLGEADQLTDLHFRVARDA